MVWKTRRLKCGCELELFIENGKPLKTKFPENPPENCPKVWDLICSGLTWGIFQIEKQAGQRWSKEYKPRSIEEMAIVQAIIRPGCADVKIDGRTITEKICRRKMGDEKVEYMHDSIKEITEKTQGFLVYQEQAMQVSQKVAGFSGVQAETLRKAAGKKNVELMEKVKGEFMEGAKEAGIVSEEEAENIFRGIEASQRYSFNASHAISYSYNAYYYSAYMKAHFPRAFYSGKLQFAKDNDKVAEVLNDAPKLDIEILPPNLLHFNAEPKLLDGKIVFPLAKIKHVSKKDVELIAKNTQGKDLNYLQWLIEGAKGVNLASFSNLILAGALDFLRVPRQKMYQEYQLLKEFSPKYLKIILENSEKPLVSILEDMINEGTGKGKALSSKTSLKLIQEKLNVAKLASSITTNDIRLLAKNERDLLGREMTCTELDLCDTFEANTNCLNVFHKRCADSRLKLPVIISLVKPYVTKNGDMMAFVEGYDLSGSLNNIVIFSDTYKKVCGEVFEGNKVMLGGSISNRGGFLVNSVRAL